MNIKDIGTGTSHSLKDRSGKRRLSELSPQERRQVLDGGQWDPDWSNQQLPGQGLQFPKVASKYGNPLAKNDPTPDENIPPEIFNFELILNSRKFKVMCDMLLSINAEEDLADYSQKKLNECLDLCSSYRFTCFCAYIAARKERKNWELYLNEWGAEKRTEARKAIRIERMSDKQTGLRKDIGQIVQSEIDDWIMVNYGKDHRGILVTLNDWKDNEKTFLELRDTIKDRGSHLQTLLRRLDDQIAPKMPDPTQSSEIVQN